MLAVVKVFKTSLVAVPALRRVEPASTSGPVAGEIRTCVFRGPEPELRPRRWAAAGPALHATRTVAAPRWRDAPSAASTNGVTPLAETPTTTSPARTRARTARPAARAPSSPPSPGRNT